MPTRRKKTILWVALLIVSLFIGKYATSSWRKYQMWETHKSFFMLPVQEQTVKTWMTPNFIQRHYGIDLDVVLGVSPGFWEARKPLADLCSNRQLDCEVLVGKLDTRIKNSTDTKPAH